MTSGQTVVNDKCMKTFKQSHDAATCGLFLQLSKWLKFKNAS